MASRTEVIGIRLTKGEHARIVEFAEKKHLKAASWARQVILEAVDASTRPQRRRRLRRSL